MNYHPLCGYRQLKPIHIILRGLRICQKYVIYIVCYQNSQDGVEFHNGFQLDIFLYGKKGTNIFPLRGGDVWDGPMDMIFPREEMMFEGFPVYIPHKYKEYSKLNWEEYPPPYPPREKTLSA